MSLRVIAGTARGHKLKGVSGKGTRPITDRVKENLFNILGVDVVDSTWWDLFGGTGAVGIEALSRGAAFVRYSEMSRAALDIIRDNLQHCKMTGQAEIRRGDAFAFLEKKPDRSFDYIYIAPPQYKGMWLRALHALDENPDWMSEASWAVVQIHPREFRDYQNLELKNLQKIDERKYGSTLLVFYEKIIA
ncbi:MAG: 16S rRNA (guanine(966)-N(2))-methyltransferase RsmD [Anaerolineales bacterium]|nr:16S rRNA (guanine(966)-N(2))-methyltransferase RsmD [Anaerolineales bacterium]